MVLEIKNEKKYRKALFWSIVCLLTVWHLLTLTLSPVPWVDEVYFASMTNSLVSGDGLTVGVGLNQNAFHYGPIYFLFTGLFTLIGGLNPFTFRLTGLLFSYLVAFAVYKILVNRGVGVKLSLLVVLVVLFDQLFVYCAHIGRMDIMAGFFVLLAFYYTDKYDQAGKDWHIVVVALFMLLALLTSLRCAVTLVPLGVYLLVCIIQQKKWVRLVYLVGIPVVGYLAWIFVSYGSIQGFIDYFVSPNETAHDENFLTRFLGGSFIISKIHYPLVLLTLVVLVHSILRKYYEEIHLYLYTIILFYLVVHSTSDTYSIMILPFYYLIIAIGLQHVVEDNHKSWRYSMYAIGVLCIFVNLGVFMAKWVVIESSQEYRDGNQLEAWIKNNVPSGTKVIGSDTYYYACLANGIDFKSLEQIWTNEEGTKNYLVKVYHPQYVFLNKYEETTEAIDCFNLLNKELVAHYEPVPVLNWLDKLVQKIGFSNKSTLEGDLYRLIYEL